MADERVVRIAGWDGWCGACLAERPLVLTRTGRRSLRSWLAGVGDEDRLLTLTCRLCGVGVVVPPEEDDPEVDADAALVSHVPADRPLADRVPADGASADRVPAASPSADRVPTDRLPTDQAPVDRAPVDRAARAQHTDALHSGRLPRPVSETDTSVTDPLLVLDLLADGLDVLSPARA